MIAVPPLQLVGPSASSPATGTAAGTATSGTPAAEGQVSSWHVPPVVGQPVQDVRRTLSTYRLRVVEQPVYSGRPVDEVVATDPPPGATPAEGSRLVVKVSAGLPAGPVDVGQELVLLNRRVGEIADRLATRDLRLAVTAGVVAGLVASVAGRARGVGAPAGAAGDPGGGDADGGDAGAGARDGGDAAAGAAEEEADGAETGGGKAARAASGSRGSGRPASTSST